MTRKVTQVTTVAECFAVKGVVGELIDGYYSRQRKQCEKLVARKKRLGPIPDKELTLIPYKKVDIMMLNPKDHKEHDHYAIIGYPLDRHRVTAAQLKKRHRKLMLENHPDKNPHIDAGVNNNIMTSLDKTYAVLSDPVKRWSYDCCDPTFDNDVPPKNEHSKQNFFDEFGPVFERNERWAKRSVVPYIGDENTSAEKVNEFYQFWGSFPSKREFSYLDKECLDDATGYTRREMKKTNNKSQAIHKNKEKARICLLVDNAIACDPRVAKFKAEEKERKNAKKKLLQESRFAEEKKKTEEEKQAKLEAKLKEEKELAEKADVVKTNQKVKKQAKREKQRIRKFAKDNNCFSSTEEEQAAFMEKIDELVAAIDINELTDLNRAVKAAGSVEEGQALVLAKMNGI